VAMANSVSTNPRVTVRYNRLGLGAASASTSRRAL
jgi:hypothetical protein